MVKYSINTCSCITISHSPLVWGCGLPEHVAQEKAMLIVLEIVSLQHLCGSLDDCAAIWNKRDETILITSQLYLDLLEFNIMASFRNG